MSDHLNKEMTVAGITYNSLHWWIRRVLGTARKCEHPECLKKSLTFEWALIRGKIYERKKENFWQLCRKCHFKYDLTENQKKKFNEGRLLANIARKGTHHTLDSKLKMSRALKGRKVWNKGKKWPAEIKHKMSLARKGKIPWNKGLKLK